MAVYLRRLAAVAYAAAAADVSIELIFYVDLHIALAGDAYLTTIGLQIGGKHFT